VFTPAFYQPPAPEHEVKAGVPLDTLLNNELTNEINRRLREGGGTLKDRTLTLRLPEESFTALLRNLIETAGTKQLDAARAQMNITKEKGLVLFLPLTDSPLKTALMVGLRAGTENGVLALSVDDLQIGDLNLPAWLYRPLIDPIIKKNLDQLNAAWGKYAKFQSINYEDGAAVVTGEIAVEILNLKP
jgi:hypothetical protein